LLTLNRLQEWISGEYKHLSSLIQTDVSNSPYLRVTKISPHPVLVTQPAFNLVCRVNSEMQITCLVQSFNMITIKEIHAAFEENKLEELKNILDTMNGHQTSICKGIPEEKLITWANRKNISQILIERFASKIVFRDRNCNIVMMDTDQADICRSCAMLLSTSSMDLMEEQELECPYPGCDRAFKYQGALDKHIIKHNQEDYNDEGVKKEHEGETINHIKLEPEVNVREGSRIPDDNDFLERLLDEMDNPPQRKKKKKKKPPTKDFNCSDCGKSFYYQKNLFVHVVEKHGKSLDELPNLNTMKEEFDVEDIVKRRKRGSKEKAAYCDDCGVSFKFASGLYNHRKRMHGNIEKLPCPHCNKEVKACTMEQHIREEHGKPRFTCQFCGKGFYYRSFMLNHQRLHTGEFKECICDLCGAVYKSVQVLNRHVRNAHQDLRNHKCMHCDKAFHNKQRLERHINSQHTKAKIWPCPVCHSRYDRKDNLRTHIRKNHSNVVNPDTVELHSIDNDGQIDIKPRHRRSSAVHEATINPETGEMEGGGGGAASGPAADMTMRAMMDRRSLIQRSHNQAVHVAHDLLSLKYGEDAAAGAGPTRYQIPTPEIKHEVGGGQVPSVGGLRFDPSQVPQWHIKVERPDLAQVSQMMGLQRAVNNMAAANSVAARTSSGGRESAGPNHHVMHGVPNPGYGFQHHNI